MRNICTDIREVMADVLNVPIGTIDDDASSETIASWDSLRHIQLILALEEQLDVQFSETEIVESNTLSRLERTISAKIHP